MQVYYDTIGNLLNDGTWTYTWKHGRQLASMTNGSKTWDYSYNTDGLRISKNVNNTTYSYHYLGDQLVEISCWDDLLMSFTYDAIGPATITYEGDTYYYTRNAQGDILYITGTEEYMNGTESSLVVSYVYDAWGNLLSMDGPMADTLGELNPLRYRGYVYDTETGLYYLQSRYYNPEWGRFISADEYTTTGQGLTANNMFAYCNNNPVNFVDTSGATPVHIALGFFNAGLSIMSDLIITAATGEEIDFLSMTVNAGIAFASGFFYNVQVVQTALTVVQAGYAFVDTLCDGGDVLSATASAGVTLLSNKAGNVIDEVLDPGDELVNRIISETTKKEADFAISGGYSFIKSEAQRGKKKEYSIPTVLSYSDPYYCDIYLPYGVL